MIMIQEKTLVKETLHSRLADIKIAGIFVARPEATWGSEGYRAGIANVMPREINSDMNQRMFCWTSEDRNLFSLEVQMG